MVIEEIFINSIYIYNDSVWLVQGSRLKNFRFFKFIRPELGTISPWIWAVAK